MSGSERDPSDLIDKVLHLEEQVRHQTWQINVLRGRLARYEAALSGSQATVSTQDRDLRYTFVSGPMLGCRVEDLVGRTDDDVMPPEGRETITGPKRDVLESGQAKRIEFAIDSPLGVRWIDLHVEPLRKEDGMISGLACTSVDVTDRKEGEAHLRLLLRELTHRSKNLLAVIQAMARQTARQAGSVDSFLNRFGARLQGMAASHDILVREGWYGASLNELVRSQLAAYVADESHVSIDGPDLVLKPEAAQNLGLALHELAVNAGKHGALLVPEGRVSVRWQRQSDGDKELIAFNWQERNGPKVKMRRKQGFGSIVIERNLERALGAQVTMDFDVDGLRTHILIPTDHFLAGR